MLPALKGRLDGLAVRVPVMDGSLVDLVVKVKRQTTKDEVNAAMKAAANGPLKGILEYCEDPIVSNDVIGNPASSVFDSLSTNVMAGDMEMHTAGSLKGGQIVWGLAKVKDSFELFKGDRIDSYLLFSNFHKYGFSTDVRFTPIRVVCNNTLSLSLNSTVERMVKISHRREFEAENVKEMLGIATHKLAKYKEMAQFLGSKRANKKQAIDYFRAIFPTASDTTEQQDGELKISNKAAAASRIVDTQPGAEFAKGSFWQLFNTVTYMTDHILGKSQDSRLVNSWYGYNRKLKTRALETAVEMAEAA